jgi:alkanesulfonate monooxygenase SsuD/methylene tetrahydromethanopterin reductase-like flavin-dependent oxidoreductase (luciferase family)
LLDFSDWMPRRPSDENDVMCRARRRVIRCSFKRGRRKTARAWPRATPRPCSPRSTPEDAQAFYTDLKARAAALGRDPASILILPGLVPVIGSTEAEAQALDEELDRLIKPEYARRQLAQTLRVKEEDLDLDAELPQDLPDEDAIEGAKSRYTRVVTLARRERLTVRQLIGRLGGGRGHRTFAGTPEQAADAMQHWWESGAADGFT